MIQKREVNHFRVFRIQILYKRQLLVVDENIKKLFEVSSSKMGLTKEYCLCGRVHVHDGAKIVAWLWIICGIICAIASIVILVCIRNREYDIIGGVGLSTSIVASVFGYMLLLGVRHEWRCLYFPYLILMSSALFLIIPLLITLFIMTVMSLASNFIQGLPMFLYFMLSLALYAVITYFFLTVIYRSIRLIKLKLMTSMGYGVELDQRNLSQFQGNCYAPYQPSITYLQQNPPPSYSQSTNESTNNPQQNSPPPYPQFQGSQSISV